MALPTPEFLDLKVDRSATLTGGTFTGTYAGDHTYSGVLTYAGTVNYAGNFVASGAFTAGGTVTAGNASANYWQLVGGAGNITIQANSLTSTNVNAILKSKGTGSLYVQSTSGTLFRVIDPTTGTIANYITTTAAIAGTDATIGVAGTDPTVNINYKTAITSGHIFTGGYLRCSRFIPEVWDSTAATAHVADAVVSFPSVTALKLFFPSNLYNPGNMVFTASGYKAPGDGGSGTFDVIAPVITTSVGSTALGSYIINVASTSGLSIGMFLTQVSGGTTSVSYITDINPGISVRLSWATVGIIAAGTSLIFRPARNFDFTGLALPANYTGVRRLSPGRTMSFEEAGLIGDYYEPVLYTVSASTTTGNVLTFTSTTGIRVGEWAHHANIPFGTTVTAVTATTITLSNPVFNIGVPTSEYVGFQPPPTDNSAQLNNAMGDLYRSGGGTMIPTAGKQYYFGANTTPTFPSIQPYCKLIGRTQAAVYDSLFGKAPYTIRLAPWTTLKTSVYSEIRNIGIARAGMPSDPPDTTTVARYIHQWWAENGVTTPKSVGLTISTHCLVSDVYVVGFNTCFVGICSGSTLQTLRFCGANGIEIHDVAGHCVMYNSWGKVLWTSNVGPSGFTWYLATAATISAAGTNYIVGDLLLAQDGGLWQITSVGAGGSVIGLNPTPIKQGVYLYQLGANVPTQCISQDFSMTYGYGGGLGTGCTLNLTTVAVPNIDGNNFLPGSAYNIHDQTDGINIMNCGAHGFRTAYELSNCWYHMISCWCEGCDVMNTPIISKGVWMWNTAPTSSSKIIDLHCAGFTYPYLIESVDGKDAIMKPQVGDGTTHQCYILEGSAQGPSWTGTGVGGPAITIGTGTSVVLRNIVCSTNDNNYVIVKIRPNAGQCILDGLIIRTQVENQSWLDCDPSSERKTTVTNTVIVPATYGLGGSGNIAGMSGPSNRVLWSQHIAHNATYQTIQRDGSLINPLIVQDLSGGPSTKDTVVLARGGTIRAPGIVGTLGTSNTGLTLDTESTTRIITTATVANGGVGYNVKSRLFGPIGDQWEVATVSGTGAVLTVTNITPGAYVGTAPTNPVATTTDNYKIGAGGKVVMTVTNGQLSGTASGGTGLYQGRAVIRIGPPGEWASLGGITYLKTPSPTGIQATATLTITNGTVTGITFTNPGSGYTGVLQPFYEIRQPQGSGCTLNLGAATTPNVLTLNPSSGVIIMPNLPTSSTGLAPGQLWNNNGLLCIL